jgi:hypothetical protein
MSATFLGQKKFGGKLKACNEFLGKKNWREIESMKRVWQRVNKPGSPDTSIRKP